MPNNKEKIYLFANWKMYLDYEESAALAEELKARAAEFSKRISMALFPSSLALRRVAEAVKDTPLKVGAQNVYWVEKGGYTGEISAHMYRVAGCEYALVGHSERRHQFHESNRDVRQKMEACLASGLTPVLCVGETLKEREAGRAEETVEVQLRSALGDLNWPRQTPLYIAYEPVWSVGTGNACDPVMAETMHDVIRAQAVGLLPTSGEPIVLYGGSVRKDNVASYLALPHIKGVLVGGAAVKLQSWMNIVEGC